MSLHSGALRGHSGDGTRGTALGRAEPGGGSALDGALADTAEEVPLEAGEEGDERRNGDHGAGRDEALVVGKGAVQIVEADGQGELGRVAEHDQRPTGSRPRRP